MNTRTYTLRDWRYYYDRPTRSWWAFKVDAEGNQVNDAIFDFRKEWIVNQINRTYGE